MLHFVGHLNLKHFHLHASHAPWVMGILNVTPDSFSDGALYHNVDSALRRAEQIVREGAQIIDVGGESTRPGAHGVSVDEEIKRVLPVVEAIGKRFEIAISVDTSKAKVAELAIGAGSCMINDVTALHGDEAMAALIARTHVGVILMHMQGDPRIMQKRPRYHDVVLDVRKFLAESVSRAKSAGIAPEKILIDPGIGFGKSLDHNLILLKHIDKFLDLGRPVVLGASRKSFIGKILNLQVKDRLYGSLGVAAFAALKGVHILRVHDVGPTVQVLKILHSISKAKKR